MSDFLRDVLTKIPELWVKEKLCKDDSTGRREMYTSVLLYLLSGMLGILCVLSLTAPFRFEIELLNNLVYINTLSDSNWIVWMSFGISLLSLVFRYTNKIMLCNILKTPSDKYFVFYQHCVVADDLLDVMAAFLSFIFIFSVFLQIYATGQLFMSFMAFCLYTWIAFNCLAYLRIRFTTANKKIIEQYVQATCKINSEESPMHK